MPETEEKLEAGKARLAASQNSNEQKIAALNAQCDEKVRDIQDRRNAEIAAVRAKTREQVDALRKKNRELQKQWDALEAKRAALHGKKVGDLFNQMIGDRIPTEAVEKLFAEKGDQLEALLHQLAGTEPESEPEDAGTEPENPENTESPESPEPAENGESW